MSVERLGNGLGDSLGLSIPYNTQALIKQQNIQIGAADRVILRRLAAGVAEYAARPLEKAKRELWYNHNDLNDTRPLFFCDPENGWYEILPRNVLECSGSLARIWEFMLRKELFRAEFMRDDKVIEPCFPVCYLFDETDRGIRAAQIGGEDGGAYTWTTPLRDYRQVAELKPSMILVDFEKTDRLLNIARETFDGLLKVNLSGAWWWAVARTDEMAMLRGLENLMLDVYDNPEGLRDLVDFFHREQSARLDYLETHSLLSGNWESAYVGSGGFGYTRQLPGASYDGKHVKTRDMWGFSESQETVGMSPRVFECFFFDYQCSILDRFGLNCYGCCEPLDKRWDIIRKIPRLRRVSVSAWADVGAMAEMLGNRYVYSWKPSPADISGPYIGEKLLRHKLRAMIRATRECHVEIIMKDNHTIGNNPENVIQWCRIAAEESGSV